MEWGGGGDREKYDVQKLDIIYVISSNQSVLICAVIFVVRFDYGFHPSAVIFIWCLAYRRRTKTSR